MHYARAAARVRAGTGSPAVSAHRLCGFVVARSGAAVPGSFAVLINAQVAAISRVSKNGTTSVVLTKREG